MSNSRLKYGKSLSEVLLFAEHVLPRFELEIFTYWTCNSMNNLSSYCGLVDGKIRASDKYLPAQGSVFWPPCTLQGQ